VKTPKVPKKYRPDGFDILHEDPEVIIGNKAPGYLTVAALWEKEKTIQNILNSYVRKGSPHSKKAVYTVHRLDQMTSGVLMFAKTQDAQSFLKHDWKSTIKTYYVIVHGKMKEASGTFSSYLTEDEDYFVHSSNKGEEINFAKTEYKVVKETPQFSILKVNLLTGKKNQIRVHLAGAGNPVVGDAKYGKDQGTRFKNLMLHSFSLEFTHPFNKKRIRVQADVPEYFKRLVDYAY
jgi:tRNA pseudouridine32 synthase/23S rRNA pseudouridine746 synthase/23S rRNA pseudouridine1911/1915/1917 synthase